MLSLVSCTKVNKVKERRERVIQLVGQNGTICSELGLERFSVSHAHRLMGICPCCRGQRSLGELFASQYGGSSSLGGFDRSHLPEL